MSFPVFFDTCTLYGALLNDFLLSLADKGAFRPLWSGHVVEELERNLSKRIGEDLTRKRVGAMNEAFPDAIVTGYEALIDQMECDEKDRHVLAAAVRANAEVIVTFNLKDFPATSTQAYEIEAVHPDEFLLDQYDLFPGKVLQTLEDLADSYEFPPMSVEQILQRMRHEVPKFADEVLGDL